MKAVPDNGDVGVDPKLKEIRITFDQPMEKGMSVVGGGDSYPDVQGKPQWENPTTIVINVKLKPNHDYWLSINNDRFRNFTNQGGEPATPYPIKFRTGAAKPAAKGKSSAAAKVDNAASAQEQKNRRAVEVLRTAIRDRYSYRDRLNINWNELFKKNEAALVAAQTPAEFAQLAGTMLAKAEDKHIWFDIDGNITPSFVKPPVPNANYKLIPTLVPNLKQHGNAVVSGRWDDGIGYVAIAAWDRGKLEGGKSALDALDDLRDTKALIVDVRLNGGGDETLAQDFAGRFVTEKKHYGSNVYRDPNSSSGFTAPKERWLQPNANGPRVHRSRGCFERSRGDEQL